MRVIKKVQFNDRFERLLDECLEEVKNALKEAKTQKEKNKIISYYGFGLDDFNDSVYRKTNDLMISCGIDSRLQRTADFVGKTAKTIYNHTH